MKYKTRRLGDVFKITSGGTPSRKDDSYFAGGEIPWVKTGDLKSKCLLQASEYITKLGLENSSAKLFPKGTVLLAMYGATIGNCSILGLEAATNQACAAFTPSEEMVPEYLYCFLLAIKPDLIRMSVGGAQPNISATILKNIEIPLPSLETQQKIADVLDKAQTLIDKRKEQLEKMDELVQSVFYEMFGDPVLNKKGWEKTRIGNVSSVKIGPFGSLLHQEDYIHGGIPLVNPSHITNGKICPDSNLTISAEKAKQLFQYRMNAGSVILGRRGEIGRCAVVTDKEEGFLCGTGSMLISSLHALNPLFLFKLLSSTKLKKILEDAAQGVTMKNLNSSIVENFEITVPPIDLQNQFAHFVEKTEQQKALMQQSLAEMENNFNSIMQRAFKGELF